MGGGAFKRPPPPPAGGGKSRGPAGRGLTRAPAGGGGYPPPLRFFEDSEKTASRSGAKFCTAVPSSFIQVP